jgi:hypothetical protein
MRCCRHALYSLCVREGFPLSKIDVAAHNMKRKQEGDPSLGFAPSTLTSYHTRARDCTVRELSGSSPS